MVRLELPKDLFLPLGDLLFQKYKDSQIRIKDHFKLVRGKTPAPKTPGYYENGTIKWINSGVLTNLRFLDKKIPPGRLVNQRAVSECQLLKAQIGTVLISQIDFDVGDKVVWNKTNDLLIGTGIYNFRSDDLENNATLFFALRNDRKEIINRLCLRGVTQFTNIRSSDLVNFRLSWVSDPRKQQIFLKILSIVF